MVNVKVTDNSLKLKQSLDDIARLQVYVGVPEEQSSRKDHDEGINNAELAFLMTNGVRKYEMRKEMADDVSEHGYHAAYDMYIQSHGSPLWQVPPRPIIQPAIEDDKEAISNLLKEALKAVLDGDKSKVMEYLNKAGMEGQAAAQDWFTDPKNGWAPNSPYTIEVKGSDKPNIDTGELRKAITYVIKEE
jgi:hypothetical protein